MAEGNIPSEIPHGGLQVKVENIHDIYEFLGNEDAPENNVLNRDKLTHDPLLQLITSTISVDAEDQTAMMTTQFAHSESKLTRDKGYYSGDQREEMRRSLFKAGFEAAGSLGYRDYYRKADDTEGELGKFFIDYGPASQDVDAAEKGAFIDAPHTVPDYIKERFGDMNPDALQKELDSEMGARNRHIILGLPIETDAGEEVFSAKMKTYGGILASVGKALYETENVPEPDKTITLKPPEEELVIDFQ